MPVLRRLPILLLLLVVATLVSPVASAQAAPNGTCTVTPNPVPVGSQYQIDAVGLTVNTAFAVHIQRTATAPQDVFATSDANGTASTGPLPGPDRTGTATATWKKLLVWPSGGGPILTYGMAEAICEWTIVA